MKAHMQARPLYDVTVSGLTSTLTGPRDIVAMYRQMRQVYSADLSLEIRALRDEPAVTGGVVYKVNWHYGHD